MKKQTLISLALFMTSTGIGADMVVRLSLYPKYHTSNRASAIHEADELIIRDNDIEACIFKDILFEVSGKKTYDRAKISLRISKLTEEDPVLLATPEFEVNFGEQATLTMEKDGQELELAITANTI